MRKVLEKWHKCVIEIGYVNGMEFVWMDGICMDGWNLCCWMEFVNDTGERGRR
jgi:hypothetical protein